MLGQIIAQTASNLGVSAFNSWLNRRAQEREFSNNRKMSELAYANDLDMWNRQSSWNRQMWDLQNEYNLPANQMKRLRDAGLNPSLIYGNGAAGGQAGKIEQASMPKYSPARASFTHMPIQIPQMIDMYQNFKLKSAQIDNVKAATDVSKEKALTEAHLRVPRYKSLRYGNDIKYINSKYQQAFNELELRQNRQRLLNQQLDADLKKADLPFRKSRAQVKGKEAEWLEKYGIRTQDPLWMRLLMQMFEGSGMDLDGIISR